MKKVFLSLFLILALYLSSCSPAPDNVIHNQKSEKGGWVYDSRFNKPVQENIEYVQIAPTWSQAFDYAGKRTDRAVMIGLAFIFLALATALFYGKSSSASWLPRVLDEKVHLFNILLFVFLASSASLYMSQPSGVKWNNDKWVEKTVYDEAMKTGSTKPIWDSLEVNCLIVDGPYGCYTK